MVACSRDAKLEALLLAKGFKQKKYCIHPCDWVLFSESFKDCDWFSHRAIIWHLLWQSPVPSWKYYLSKTEQ